MKRIIGLLAIFSTLTAGAKDCDLSGLDIMKKQKNVQHTPFEYEEQELTLVDIKSKVETKRTLRRHIKEKDKLQKSLITFTGPADIKGTALLTWEQNDREDDQWLYVPGIGKMQRIAGSGKKKYFMGTDFTFADLERESLENYQYECQKVTKCKKKSRHSCYVIDALPKDKKIQRSTGYKRRKIYVRKDNFVTTKIKYYDKKDKLLKTLFNSKWKQFGEIWRAGKSTMKRKGFHKTTIEIKDRSVDKQIADKTFSARFIKTGDYLR